MTMKISQKFLYSKAGEKCPACNAHDKPKGGVLQNKQGRFGEFVGCNRYPQCKFTGHEDDRVKRLHGKRST